MNVFPDNMLFSGMISADDVIMQHRTYKELVYLGGIGVQFAVSELYY